jgi:hypothetical protein
VVDVEQRPLRALEQHEPLVVERLPDHPRRVGDERLEPVAERAELLGHRVEVERRVLRERPQRLALRLHRGADLLAQDLLVEQVLDADPEARRLVGVARADPAPRRADLQLAELRLARVVEELVVRHDHVRVRGYPQPAHVDPAPAQPVDLLEQHGRVDDDPVADRAVLAGVEDPGGDQVELPDVGAAHDRVAGVVAALEAHDDVGLLGDEVGDLALALVAPLGADDREARHRQAPASAAGARAPSAPGSR